MRYLVILTILLVNMWSMESMAADLPMRFRVKTFGLQNNLEKSVIWNPTTQEAMIRMGVVPTYVDPFFEDNYVNFMAAEKVEVTPLDAPEIINGCDQVSQWQFEYRSGLPDYLLFITLKGPNCLRLAENLEYYNTRFRFLKASTQTYPIDVSIEIGR
ncbi:hypothetical protein [Bdellovibrio svalbardensis]|uniref:Uncharacterized protein n=1 Tax=Bdellovibrio svalbardensis TaxID=2972972 RepID=A0ABT6DJP2_9BACT|nr:hypothetical protein [Bdellovibrio svalbardensis]MDG0817087.1 hypothetical protein [Bdellovibrio svalbardensis]